jgi:transcriptional regulator with XRE-family HTH domain
MSVNSTLAEIAGRNARRIRTEEDVSLETFARAMRRRGEPWTAGRVSDLEFGRVSDSLSLLYVVALALQDTTGHKVTLADLFDEPGQVQINDDLPLQLRAVQRALQGHPVSALRLSARVKRPTDDFVDTDFRICRRLGVDPDIGAAAMQRLWGSTFVAERDRRAGPDAKPQHRGQVSRQLQSELRAELGK